MVEAQQGAPRRVSIDGGECVSGDSSQLFYVCQTRSVIKMQQLLELYIKRPEKEQSITILQLYT